MNKPYFKHYVVELTANSDNLNSIEWLKQKVEMMLSQLKIKHVKNIYHQFTPVGISLVYILSSSHIAIHTWPENNYLHIDLVTCSRNGDIGNISEIVKSVFDTTKFNLHELNYYEK
jgi:S-adenosylmethionine decarboxylase